MIDSALSEVGGLAAEAIEEIASRSVSGYTLAGYVESDAVPWGIIGDGGWDQVGVREADDGAGATLRDLVAVAGVWGAFAIPLPLVESIVVNRWSAAAREIGGPLTVAVAAAGIPRGSGLIPFGALPTARVAVALGSDSDSIVPVTESVPEPFAIPLRTVQVNWSSTLPADAHYELQVLWAAEAVGAAQRLLDLSVKYSKERFQFGKAIGGFQAVKHRLADMHIETQLAESAVLWASLDPEHAEGPIRHAVDAAIGVAEGAIQIHGAMGFTWEMGLHYHLRSMLAWRELIGQRSHPAGH